MRRGKHTDTSASAGPGLASACASSCRPVKLTSRPASRQSLARADDPRAPSTGIGDTPSRSPKPACSIRRMGAPSRTSSTITQRAK